jgi:hypothetical protein
MQQLFNFKFNSSNSQSLDCHISQKLFEIKAKLQRLRDSHSQVQSSQKLLRKRAGLARHSVDCDQLHLLTRFLPRATLHPLSPTTTKVYLTTTTFSSSTGNQDSSIIFINKPAYDMLEGWCEHMHAL